MNHHTVPLALWKLNGLSDAEHVIPICKSRLESIKCLRAAIVWRQGHQFEIIGRQELDMGLNIGEAKAFIMKPAYNANHWRLKQGLCSSNDPLHSRMTAAHNQHDPPALNVYRQHLLSSTGSVQRDR